MSNHFKVKSVTDLNNAKLGDIIPESDYSTLTSDGKFVQLEYCEDQVEELYEVTPGIYTITSRMNQLVLEKTTFTSDKILDDFVNTSEIENKADCFFRNVHRYQEFGIDIPKRNILLFGPPGTGKSSALAKVCNKYTTDFNDTLVAIFPTEKFEAHQIKDFLKRFDYKDVSRLILVMEDIGGMEMEEVRRGADSGLLSLLDNQEKTLKIPTLIIATTNFPEALMSSLTNRPGRFDDKIRVGFPKADARLKLAEFFYKQSLDENTVAILTSSTSNVLTPAHIKEAVIRSAIHEKPLYKAFQEILKEIEEYKKNFADKGKGLGFGLE